MAEGKSFWDLDGNYWHSEEEYSDAMLFDLTGRLTRGFFKAMKGHGLLGMVVSGVDAARQKIVEGGSIAESAESFGNEFKEHYGIESGAGLGKNIGNALINVAKKDMFLGIGDVVSTGRQTYRQKLADGATEKEAKEKAFDNSARAFYRNSGMKSIHHAYREFMDGEDYEEETAAEYTVEPVPARRAAADGKAERKASENKTPHSNTGKTGNEDRVLNLYRRAAEIGGLREKYEYAEFVERQEKEGKQLPVFSDELYLSAVQRSSAEEQTDPIYSFCSVKARCKRKTVDPQMFNELRTDAEMLKLVSNINNGDAESAWYLFRLIKSAVQKEKTLALLSLGSKGTPEAYAQRCRDEMAILCQ